MKEQEFKIRSRYFFITFPKVQKHNIKSVIKLILEKEKHIEFILVAEELHKSISSSIGYDHEFFSKDSHSPTTSDRTIVSNKQLNIKKNYHYHIILIFRKSKDVQSSVYFNYIFNSQGHYEKILNLDKALEYCKKENDYII